MDVGVLPSPTPDSMLRDARLLNSDTGRHSVKCNFSSRLAGRFYQNGSLERNTLRKSRLVEMQAKKRRLEKELQLEERRVKLLEERLNDTERAREDAHGLIITLGRGVVRFQAFVRRRQALRLFRAMQHEALMRGLAARFLQCRYRGWKGRVRADSHREYLRQTRRNESAATIQANVRRRSQRKIYLDLLMERNTLSNQSAAAIQAILRGNVSRRTYLAEMSKRQDAAMNTQRVWRGALGRIEAERLRQELIRKRIEAEKPKRVPLHLRKYSTYGAPPRRSANNNGTKKRDARMRRRSSDAMIIMKDGRLSSLSNFNSSSASSGDPDENDSIASTITSLTGTEDNSRRRRQSNRNRANPPSWPSPQQVTGLNRRMEPCNKVNSSRRSSLERRMTISGGILNQMNSQRPPRERQSTVQLRNGSDSKRSTPRERQKSGGVGGLDGELRNTTTTDPSSPKTEKSEIASPPAARREMIKTPITVSEEASLIVQEVLGKSIMSHSIVHSVFDDEFSENEDDLV
ncbi:hypothetical protein ACHAXR_003579 [Thalassiosira sp. AJA248-18]